MDNLIQDLRYAGRMLRKSPGFVAVAVITLALGIGANTTIFSTLYATLIRPFSFSTTDRLLMLWERNLDVGVTRGSVAVANFVDWREQNQTLEQLTLMRREVFDLTASDEPERVQGTLVSANFFSALDVKPLYGRTFAPDEDQAEKSQVIVLRNSLWKRAFAADPKIINQPVSINNKTYTVIGVMPEDFNFPVGEGDLWTPLVLTPAMKTNRGNHSYQALGLLKPGVTIEQAREDLNAIAIQLQQQYPESNAGKTVRVLTLTEDATRGARMYSPVMLGAVGFVLLIACANVANLLLVRGASRQKEIAVRLAMGASRWRLIRQLLTESLLLALIGGLFGLGLSVWGIEALANGIPEGFSRFIPGWQNLEINQTAFLFTLAISLATGLLFGLVPAFQATRTNLNETLKDGGKGTPGKGTRNRTRSLLVVSEVALSLVLLIGAGLMIRTFINLLNADFGVDPANVLKLRVSLPVDSYKKPEQRRIFFDQFLQRVAALPGVVSASGINTVPMGGRNNSSAAQRIGETVYEPNQRPYINNRIVTPGYFETMKMRFKEGRSFDEQDQAASPQVAIVNEAFAKRFFPERSPIGQQINVGGDRTKEIIAVTKNVMNDDMDEFIEPEMYVPYAQETGDGLDIIVRTQAEPTALTAALRGELAQMDKRLPVFDIKTMNQIINERMSPKRLMAFMLGIFALIALLLAGVGIYAVMSYSVAQRTHEIGIRLALGASASNILRLVLGHGLVLTATGLALGMGGALLLTRAMSGMLYGVAATDLLTFAGIALVLAAISALACYLPARRATRVDPMIALRYE